MAFTFAKHTVFGYQKKKKFYFFFLNYSAGRCVINEIKYESINRFDFLYEFDEKKGGNISFEREGDCTVFLSATAAAALRSDLLERTFKTKQRNVEMGQQQNRKDGNSNCAHVYVYLQQRKIVEKGINTQIAYVFVYIFSSFCAL